MTASSSAWTQGSGSWSVREGSIMRIFSRQATFCRWPLENAEMESSQMPDVAFSGLTFITGAERIEVKGMRMEALLFTSRVGSD